VRIAVADAEPAIGLKSESERFSPQTSVEPGFGSPQIRGVLSSSTMDRGIAARAAIKAGVLGFFMGMLIPFLSVVLAGTLAVYFYRSQSGIVLPTKLASRLGGAAGVVATGIQSLYFIVWIFVFHRQKEYVDSVTRVLHSFGADSSIPDVQASLHTMFTPAGLTVTLVLVMILALLLSSVGGALGSLWMRPRGPRA
jgi:hypothetical protein